MLKSIAASKIVEEMLQDMNFKHGDKVKHNPYNIISEKRKQSKIYDYDNQFSTELHRVANQCD